MEAVLRKRVTSQNKFVNCKEPRHQRSDLDKDVLLASRHWGQHQPVDLKTPISGDIEKMLQSLTI